MTIPDARLLLLMVPLSLALEDPPAGESGLVGYAELAPDEARSSPSFTDVRFRAGCEELTATWGVSWFDVQRDGLPDLWLSHHMHYRSALHQNAGAWSFRSIASELGESVGLDDHFSGWADVDGDGDGDVYSACGFHRPDSLMMNEGGGTFRDATKQSGIEFVEEGRGRAAIFSDLDGDSYLDLLVLNDDTPDFYYVGSEEGVFSEGTRAAGLENIYRKRGAVAADLDNDGDIDLYVPLRAHDQKNLLLLNRGDATFAERAAGSGADLIGMSLAAAVGDVDGDGFLDLYVARRARSEDDRSRASRPDVLLRNLTNGKFEEITEKAGIFVAGGESRDVGFGDFDNDGALDVFVVDGGSADDGDRPDSLWLNAGDATFTEVSDRAGVRGPASASGSSAAFADVDRDGFLDLAVSHGAGARGLQGPLRLFRNHGGDGRWLLLRIDGGAGNRDGFGARVSIRRPDGRVIVRENSVFRNLSQDEPIVHVGLGADRFVVEVSVSWPDGQTSRMQGVPTNEIASITRGARNRFLSSHPAALLGLVTAPDLDAIAAKLPRIGEAVVVDDAAEITARREELLAYAMAIELRGSVKVTAERVDEAMQKRPPLPRRTWIEHVAVGRFTERRAGSEPKKRAIDDELATAALEELREGKTAHQAAIDLDLRGWTLVYGEGNRTHTGYGEAGWMTREMIVARFGEENADRIRELAADESFGPFVAREHLDVQDPDLVHEILHVVRRGPREEGGSLPREWVDEEVRRDLRRESLRRLVAEAGGAAAADEWRAGDVDSVLYSVAGLARAAVDRGLDQRSDVRGALDRIPREVALDRTIGKLVAAAEPTDAEVDARVESHLFAWYHFRRITGTLLFFMDRIKAEDVHAALVEGGACAEVVAAHDIPHLRDPRARGGGAFHEEVVVDQPTWLRTFGYKNVDVLKTLEVGVPTAVLERGSTYRIFIPGEIHAAHRHDTDDARRIARKELRRARAETAARDFLFGRR